MSGLVSITLGFRGEGKGDLSLSTSSKMIHTVKLKLLNVNTGRRQDTQLGCCAKKKYAADFSQRHLLLLLLLLCVRSLSMSHSAIRRQRKPQYLYTAAVW